MSEIAAGYPDLLANGPEALRANPWNRSHVEDASRPVSTQSRRCGRHGIAAHREAAESLATARRQLGAGDARAALAGLEEVLRRVPSAPIHADLERARQLRADQQAQEDRLRSLLHDASEAVARGQSETVLALAQEALRIDPQHAEARDFMARAERNLKAAEAERARQCEKLLDRARRAIQVEQLEEAERQLELAKQSGAALPDIAVVSTAITEARTARDKANAVVREVATELATARTEFQKGERPAALARLRALTVQYPSNAAAQTELARLLAEHSRLAAAERAAVEAERLAKAAADAMSLGDDATARQLADQALALAPGRELALRVRRRRAHGASARAQGPRGPGAPTL
jgi:tetratricopeptide (TPR) repeat protein